MDHILILFNRNEPNIDYGDETKPQSIIIDTRFGFFNGTY